MSASCPVIVCTGTGNRTVLCNRICIEECRRHMALAGVTHAISVAHVGGFGEYGTVNTIEDYLLTYLSSSSLAFRTAHSPSRACRHFDYCLVKVSSCGFC